jgi:hypothetical protein
VVLYGKEGCHLCDEAREMLDSLTRQGKFTVREVDITSDDGLFQRYEFLIPVVQIDGERELCAPIRLDHLRQALS